MARRNEVDPMFKRILVPLDGSKTAESALPYARGLAEKLDAEVELLEVIDVAEIPAEVSDQTAFADNLRDHVNRRLNQYLAPIAESFSPMRAKCRVEQGSPATVIIGTAAADKETLIIMASHGRSGLQRWLLGSVAEKVLRGTANPLLLVRAAEPAPSAGQATFGSIVVALDGSELGEMALAPALELSRALKIALVLVRAYQLPITAYYRADDYPASAAAFIPSYAEVVEEMGREAREYIDAKMKELRDQGLEHVRAEILEGNAADEVIKLAGSQKNSLIAMCTHGRSGVKRWMLGSITEKVVHYSATPVLVIPARS
jgi:nucleotide-binding universal stress UspA family protein